MRHESQLNGSRLLVVEDDADMREALTRCLRREGAWVSEAGDGLQALKSLQVSAFDLVISDVHMPNMNGLDLTKEVKRVHQVPVLLMTGEPKSPEEISELEGQAVGLIHKPVALAAFIQEVSLQLDALIPAISLLSPRRQRRQLWFNMLWSTWFLGLGLCFHFPRTALSAGFVGLALAGPVLLRLGTSWLLYWRSF